MKKILKTLALVCIMVFMCGMAVSADEAQIAPTIVKKGTENPTTLTAYSYSYGQADLLTIGSEQYCGKIIPIYISEPGLLHLYFNTNQYLSTQVQVLVMSDRNVAYGYGKDIYTTDALMNETITVKIASAGQYYILFNSSTGYSTLTSNTVTFSAALAGNNSYGTVPTSVTSKKATVNFYDGYYTGSSKDLYIKYKAPSSGYLSVTAQNGYGYITLCNSKKKALSTKDTINVDSATNKKTVYGVKAGRTYYIKVNSSSDEFSIKLQTTKVSDKSRSSKKKARSMTHKKTYKGTIVAGSSTKDWYKIVLKKSSKVTIDIKASTNETLKLTVYDGKKSMGSFYMTGNGYKNTLKSVNSLNTSKRAKWSKGTYYIKVERAYSTSSGYYSLKWQKK